MSTKFVPLTTRPASTSRQGMTRLRCTPLRLARPAARAGREPARPDRAAWLPRHGALRRGAEDVIPPRGAHAEAPGVVLEVVAHVRLAQPPPRAGARRVV